MEHRRVSVRVRNASWKGGRAAAATSDARVASGSIKARLGFLSGPESSRVIGRLRTHDIAPCKCARPPRREKNKAAWNNVGLDEVVVYMKPREPHTDQRMRRGEGGGYFEESRGNAENLFRAAGALRISKRSRIFKSERRVRSNAHSQASFVPN